jgi:hypothetical protein
MCEHDLQLSGDFVVCKKCLKVWASKEVPNYIPMPYPVYPNPYPVYPSPTWVWQPTITCGTGTANIPDQNTFISNS